MCGARKPRLTLPVTVHSPTDAAQAGTECHAGGCSESSGHSGAPLTSGLSAARARRAVDAGCRRPAPWTYRVDDRLREHAARSIAHLVRDATATAAVAPLTGFSEKDGASTRSDGNRRRPRARRGGVTLFARERLDAEHGRPLGLVRDRGARVAVAALVDAHFVLAVDRSGDAEVIEPAGVQAFVAGENRSSVRSRRSAIRLPSPPSNWS